jgi:hypothetical protein
MHRSSRIQGAVIAVALLLFASGADAAVMVSRTIPFGEDAGATQAVRDQCTLQTRVPAFIQEFAPDVQLVDGPLPTKSGRALELSIIEVHAPGGGVFSGPKWMAVYGKLWDAGQLVGSFRAKRFSTGGAFGEFKGTCSILGRCAKAIGMDIGRWLEKPTLDAELGDAR